jgi:phospholipase/carboxylesterase
MTKATPPLVMGEATKSAAVVCVFVHGRGQSPEAMQDHVLQHLRTPGVHYVLPRATNGTWYTAKATDSLTALTRAELAQSLDQVRHSLAELPQDKPLLLAGFSQGACLSLEYAMAYGPWHGALVAFTGCRVGTRQDQRPHADLAGLPVYLSGSDADPWIPVSAFASAVQDLATSRARLRCDVFPGRPHEVSSLEIAMLDATLGQLAKGQEVAW